jgi:hypothetical protein
MGIMVPSSFGMWWLGHYDALGMIDFNTKDVTVEELFDKIKTSLGNGK